MVYFVIFISLIYIIFVLRLILAFTQIKYTPSTVEVIPQVKICLIIPVRNEAKNILNLVQDIEKQDFDKKYFEVIIVDDFSIDETWDLLQQFEKTSHLRLKILKLHQKNTISSKKTAITQAIHATEAELLITTDGDCRVGEGYLKTVHDFYLQTHRPKLISAPVCFFEPKTVLEKILFVEFSSLIMTGASLIALGKPSMCNGANLIFQKSAFLEVNGYEGFEQIPSGDDEFLLKKMAKKYPQQIQFLKSKEAVIRTQPPENLSQFYLQRKRWASKWKLHEGWEVKILAVFVFGFHALNMLLGIRLIFQLFEFWEIILGHFILKFILEYFFLSKIIKLFTTKKYIWYIFLLQFLYSPYAIFFGILANVGGYEWKGRKFK